MRIFEQNLNGSRTKFELKSNFKFVGRKFVWCFIALKNFKKIAESKPLKTSCEFVIFQIRIDFLNKNSNFN